MDLPPRAEPHTCRSDFGWPDEALLIGVPGTIDPTKEPALTLRAFAELSRQRPDARLIFMGDWPLDYGLSDLVRELNLGERVEFMGRVEPLARLEQAMATCDIIVNLRQPTIGEHRARRCVQWRWAAPWWCVISAGLARFPPEAV